MPKFDFSSIPGHQVHEVAPAKKANEPKVPVSGQLDSKNLASYAYDVATRRLAIKFHSGRTYTYNPVSPSQLRALLDAESANDYFKRHIEVLDGQELTKESKQ